MAEERDTSTRPPATPLAPPMLDQFGMPVRSGSESGRRRGNESKRTNTGGAKPSGAPPEAVEAEQQQIVFWMFVILTIGITVLQKIGYHPGGATGIALILPLIFAVFGIGILFAKPIFRPERAILYMAVVIVSALSSILLAKTYSITSMGLYFTLYLPFLVSFDTTKETYRRCMNFFSTMMLIFAVIVWLQHAIQFTIGWEHWPDLDKLLPSIILLPEFNYIQPIKYGLDYMKPSGITFLEVSILSQFLTFALILEITLLQRTWRAVFFGATLFATFAGTGLFLLLVSLPFLVTRMTTRTFAIVLATVFVALFVALQLHWFDLIANRVSEFDKAGSSANSRFIEPLNRIRTALLEPSAVYSGVGAGQIERGGNTFWWPITKTTVEYGVLQGIMFYVFFLFSMFDNAPSRRFAFVLVIWFSFEGTLQTPLNPIGCIMLSTMFLVQDGASQRRRTRQSPGEEARLAQAI